MEGGLMFIGLARAAIANFPKGFSIGIGVFRAAIPEYSTMPKCEV
jgi:hypothetical protein